MSGASAWVYLLRCGDGSLYCGWTTDVARRVAQHESGRGGRYTRSRLPVALVAALPMPDRTAARREEARIKTLTRAHKLAIVEGARALIRGGAGSRTVGMESVWDYPRPPVVVPCHRRVRVVVGDALLADSTRALRVLETSHPPTIYIPPADVRAQALVPSRAAGTRCEFKGRARYLDLAGGEIRTAPAAWTYPQPAAGFELLRDHVAFYPSRVDEAWLDDERVQAQDGDFYGGWITADLAGPFKGAPGTLGW